LNREITEIRSITEDNHEISRFFQSFRGIAGSPNNRDCGRALQVDTSGDWK
jgi:hypothetical protein